MSKKPTSISNPEELNKHLQYSSPVTWIVLGSVLLLLGGLFAWASLAKVKAKLTGTATIVDHVVTLDIQKNDLAKLSVDQKVYILDLEGSILSLDEDNNPTLSNFDLEDGNYPYTIVLKEVRPIQFLFGE